MIGQISSAQDFVRALASYEGSDTVFNPWREYDERYDIVDAPLIRQRQLEAYITPRLGAPYIVVAEAVGYQGGRFTGIAITCERMLLGHHKTIAPSMILPGICSRNGLANLFSTENQEHAPGQHSVEESQRVIYEGGRTSRSDSEYIEKNTQRRLGFNEPTDTIVWNSILENSLDPYKVLLWNIFPFHPHKANEPMSNRTPTQTELDAGWAYTKALLALNGEAKIFAVGQKAATTLAHYGVEAVALRHPANGGANLYKEQFKAAIK